MRLRLRSCLPCIRLNSSHSLRLLNAIKPSSLQQLHAYSTFEATLMPSPSMVSPRTRPQIKNMSPYEWVARHRQVSEVMPMVSALLHEGKLEEAEETVISIMKYRMEEWLSNFSTSIANMFIQAYAKNNQFEGVEKWRQYLWSSSVARPDVITYSILLKFHFENGRREECQGLIDEMEEVGCSIERLVEAEYFDQPSTIESIFKFAEREINDPSLLRDGESLFDVSDLLSSTADTSNVTATDTTSTSNTTPSASLPEVNSVESKSDGISFLKESLKILREGRVKDDVDKYLLQEQLEKDCLEAMTQRIYTEIENYKKATGAKYYGKNLRRLLQGWHTVLTEELRNFIDDPTSMELSMENRPKIGTGVFLSSLLSTISVEKISLVVLQELTRVSTFDFTIGGMTVVKLSTSIGKSLEKEVFATQLISSKFLRITKLSSNRLKQVFNSKYQFEMEMRRQYAAMERNEEALRNGWIPKWSNELQAEMGTFLLQVALSCLKYKPENGEEVPAFTHKILQKKTTKLGLIVPNKELFDQLATESLIPFIEPWAMPMLVPPRPWITAFSGGYLSHRTVCVRLKDSPLHLSLLQQADREGKLDKLLWGLDVLGSTSWKINDKILQVALNLWNNGVNVATLEKHEKDLPLLEYKKPDAFESREEYIKYVKEVIERREQRGKAHSTMCDTNYKLEIARQFSGIEFYLPHSVDFRGRAYPIPPHLSHVGSDLSRGLLVFSVGRPLGPQGLRWLKIQLSNMAGFDKASLDERAEYAEKNRENIMDSADDPINGKGWWKGAEEPWQCLATCIELTAAWRSSNPEEYISHLPVQQDGSCNGLQHYAALGRDIEGATQVNLAPSDRPQDVYSAVARLVIEKIEKDAAADPTHIAAFLLNKINRKIVKQTVMTNVYGVTKYGARQQIQDRLKEYQVVDPSKYALARGYLVDAVFDSLGTLFEKAQLIQEWLTGTAKEIALSVAPDMMTKFGANLTNIAEEQDLVSKISSGPADRYPLTSVIWTNSIGFQVVQPYSRSSTINLRTVLQQLTLKKSSKFDPIDASKQSSAFPPNFIHSLDASHMFLTAIECARQNVTFASVHDCFWTHASTVDQMNSILRDKFVELHSADILGRLREEFIAQYGNHMVPVSIEQYSGVERGNIKYLRVREWRPIRIPPLPPRGDFDIELVRKSTYFFS